MARLSSAWFSSAQLGSAWLGSAQLGSARLGTSCHLGRHGSARVGSTQVGSVQPRVDAAWLSSAWFSAAWLGSVLGRASQQAAAALLSGRAAPLPATRARTSATSIHVLLGPGGPGHGLPQGSRVLLLGPAPCATGVPAPGPAALGLPPAPGLGR